MSSAAVDSAIRWVLIQNQNALLATSQPGKYVFFDCDQLVQAMLANDPGWEFPGQEEVNLHSVK
jgi:hypothetical protein